MSSRQFSARFDTSIVERLERRAARTGASKSQLAERYIDEGMRMEAHPGVVFRDGATGRRAGLASGPDIWQVIWVLQSGEDRGDAAIAGTADWMALSVDQVRSAIRYYADFPDEVDERIRRNTEIADEAEERWRREQLISA
jgi:hypothetical protein